MHYVGQSEKTITVVIERTLVSRKRIRDLTEADLSTISTSIQKKHSILGESKDKAMIEPFVMDHDGKKVLMYGCIYQSKNTAISTEEPPSYLEIMAFFYNTENTLVEVSSITDHVSDVSLSEMQSIIGSIKLNQKQNQTVRDND